MPFQLTNDQNQLQMEKNCNARLVNFLSWQKFENIKAGSAFPLITNEFNQVIQYFQWGLVPAWAKNVAMGNNMAKTKIENLKEKDALQAIFQYKRCIIPVTKFECWANKEKTLIFEKKVADQNLFLLAGLWSVWGEGLNTFSVLTKQTQLPENSVDYPVILNETNKSNWLSNKPKKLNDFIFLT